MRTEIMRSFNSRYVWVALVGAGILGCMGGSGSTDGGSGANPDFRDDVFVGDASTAGTIKVSLNSSEITVGSTSGFKVYVKDGKGEPVPNINIVCDSEQGVAILEPTAGYELTNENGEMSGRIGCRSPGSYQMVCRLNIGANKRQFVSVCCTGDIPSGFTGFPGAAGGGLGGGSQSTTDGDIQIVAAGFVDDGDLQDSVPVNASIDILQGSNCDNDATTTDFEPFYDTYAAISVRNNLSERVEFSSLKFAILNFNNTGEQFVSTGIDLIKQANSSVEAKGQTTIIQVPIFKAASGCKFPGTPQAACSGAFSAEGLGTVEFTLTGETASGELVTLSASTTAAFANYNRCPAS